MDATFKTTLSPELTQLRRRHFTRFPSLGTLDKPTKKGLLLIAKRGAETWLQWQTAFAENSIDFEGVDFSRYRVNFSKFKFLANEISFSDSNFNDIQFQECQFRGITSFNGCKFTGKSSFAESHFAKIAFFSESQFDRSDFSGCIFSRNAKFTNCSFGSFSSFSGAKFANEVDFRNSTFSEGLLFLEVETSSVADFSKCEFGNAANFHNTKFNLAYFIESRFFGWSEFSCESDSPSKTIRQIRFAGAVFDGQISFENRHFDGETDFGCLVKDKGQELINTKFNSAPLFHGCKIHQDTSFHGAIFKDIPGQKAARAYRTLKLAMEQLKSTREEQRFFRLEMKAERPSLSLPRKALSTIYEWCSDYGFSLWRPLVALLVFSLIFGGAHGLLSNTCTEQPECAASAEPGNINERTSDLIKYVLVNVAPVPGLDKMQTDLRKPLFGEHGPIAVAAIILEILHKIVALVMTFLFALGLRNLFKMKS